MQMTPAALRTLHDELGGPTALWLGYSAFHGWVLLDRALGQNRPGSKTEYLTFERVTDWSEVQVARCDWDAMVGFTPYARQAVDPTVLSYLIERLQGWQETRDERTRRRNDRLKEEEQARLTAQLLKYEQENLERIRATPCFKRSRADALVLLKRELKDQQVVERAAIKAIVSERAIQFLVHFTSVRNLPSILTRGLLPRHKLASQKVDFRHNDELRMEGMTEATSLSIKADVSFLGFKLSLEPSQETVDELLDDVDEVLRRIGRRVIVVIDDLDRLDAKTVNNVLFATRRTFKLSQATYVLCYDTEVLAGGKEEGSRAREFLEKFVTVKLSLFVDSSSICNFLRRDWEKSESQLGSVPSDTMLKLGAVLNELAEILSGDHAAKYQPLLGDLRKVKRFINAILLMQIEKTNLGRTDFNKRDLINLMLLHLNYPGLFRRIYAEETEGRSGTFSIRRKYDEPNFKNVDGFAQVKEEHPGPARFLLEQLFDVEVLDLGDGRNIEESVLRSRACFNKGNARNLEGFLKLIVRLATPEPQETFVLYQGAVDRVRKGRSIAEVLAEAEFALERAETAHDQFWRVLVNQAHDFTSPTAEDAIETLVEYLPRYSSFDNDDRGLRPRSIYSLLRLLDRASWGRTAARRRVNSPENVVEIAWRIFGEQAFVGRGLLERLASPGRGVLGWNDLMLFRLQCSADRGGQLYNLHTALIVHQDRSAPSSGLVSQLALMGMRMLSQQVFGHFKRTYIESRRNFFAEAREVSVDALLGQAFLHLHEQASLDPASEQGDATIARRAAAARSSAASFFIYQLSNSLPPNGSGVGCGYYDESGSEDGGGICRLMNEYVFDFCFSPVVDGDNVLLFLDHCLAHLSSPFHTGRDEEGYVATKSGLPGGLDPNAMGRYWLMYRNHIRGLGLQDSGRCVFLPGYTAFYRDNLDGVFAVLDELAEEAASATPVLDH